jgi:hypothetical protein
MFQADNVHTTTAPRTPVGSAASLSPKAPKYGVTCSQIMKRAWQLAALNNPTRKDKRREKLGRWMCHAWDKARRGHTDNWTFLSPEHEARCLEHQLVTLQYDDRRTEAHYTLMQSLRDSISDLRRHDLPQPQKEGSRP